MIISQRLQLLVEIQEMWGELPQILKTEPELHRILEADLELNHFNNKLILKKKSIQLMILMITKNI